MSAKQMKKRGEEEVEDKQKGEPVEASHLTLSDLPRDVRQLIWKKTMDLEDDNECDLLAERPLDFDPKRLEEIRNGMRIGLVS